MNGDFLRAMFAGIAEGCGAILHSFPGDPSENASWIATPWTPGNRVPRFLASNNNYVCVSSFARSGDGRFYRRKMLFDALHALMIDDLGTKLPMSDLKLAPSALIETSPGNHQAWLFLKQPIRSLKRAEALIDAMISQGINSPADPGMKGVTRVARLPEGTNGKKKYNPAHRHRVVESNLDLRYAAEDIIATYNLNVVEKAPDEAIVKPRFLDPDRLKMLGWLKELGHYQYKVRAEYHAILCPFYEQHSDRSATGTYFMEPGPGNTWMGGFVCNHGHCSDRDINDLMAWVRAQHDMARAAGKPAPSHIQDYIPKPRFT